MAPTLPCTLGLTGLLLITCSAPAIAQDGDGGLYARAFGGASFLSDTDLTGAITGPSSFGSGQIYGAAIGYDYPDSPFRSELEFAYRSADPDISSGFSGDFASTTFAVNGYYMFSPRADGKLTPYIGAGIAYVSEIDFDIGSGPAAGEYSDAGGFAYQAMIGAEYRLSDRWSVNGEIRYFDAGRQTLQNASGPLSADYTAADVIIGATLRF